MSELEMSCIAIVESCVEDALARQKAGRVTREDCVETMAKAMAENMGNFCNLSPRQCRVKGGCACWADAEAMLDAAIASGYVVINRP